jgi:hypothetical protein
MKIRYEAEVKDCMECTLLFRVVLKCLYDNTYAVQEGHHSDLPCQIRPCPIEVK